MIPSNQPDEMSLFLYSISESLNKALPVTKATAFFPKSPLNILSINNHSIEFLFDK